MSQGYAARSWCSLADGEWVMNNNKIPISEYEKLAQRFNPTEFDTVIVLDFQEEGDRGTQNTGQ